MCSLILFCLFSLYTKDILKYKNGVIKMQAHRNEKNSGGGVRWATNYEILSDTIVDRQRKFSFQIA